MLDMEEFIGILMDWAKLITSDKMDFQQEEEERYIWEIQCQRTYNKRIKLWCGVAQKCQGVGGRGSISGKGEKIPNN